MRALAILTFVLLALAGQGPACAAEPALAIEHGDARQTLAASALLARPDATMLSVPHDGAYGHAMTYRAVPLLALLGPAAADRFDTIEARAADGFVTQIPLALIARGGSGGAVAWVAVEDPSQPWPKLPGMAVSAGPFYLVWDHPERSGVHGEQWPYALLSLTFVESPVHRWPQLALPAALPADAPARRGQLMFLTNCIPCHRLDGAGEGEVGPDLGRPKNVTFYITDAGLRAIVRDPPAVRSWPGQKMKGFAPSVLPDADLDAVVAYLHAMAEK